MRTIARMVLVRATAHPRFRRAVDNSAFKFRLFYPATTTLIRHLYVMVPPDLMAGTSSRGQAQIHPARGLSKLPPTPPPLG